MKYKNIIKVNQNLVRDNLPRIKDGAYVINLDEYSDIGNYPTYFDSFGVEYIPNKKLKHLSVIKT